MGTLYCTCVQRATAAVRLPSSAVRLRQLATKPSFVPKPPPTPAQKTDAPPLPASSQAGTNVVPEPPKAPNTGIFQRMLKGIQQDVEQAPKEPEDKIKPLTEEQVAKVLAEEQQKKKGLLNRWDEKLTVQRRELEAQQKVKRQQGQKARVSPTMQKRMDEYLDLEANRREREELFKKAFRDGYWDDYKETARKGAKLWDAPKRMRVPSASPLVPNPTATNLNGEVTDVLSLVKNKKASLVTFMFSAFGEAHVNAYVQPFLKEFQNVPEVQLIQLNIEENPYKAPVLRMLSKFIKWKVPTENRGNYLMYYKSIADSRRAAGMTNNVLGWVNLVDQQGKIRWQAHGVPKEHELESMSKLLRQLAGLPPSPAKKVDKKDEKGKLPK